MGMTGTPDVVYTRSEGEQFNADTTLIAVTCSTCHVTYAIPESLNRAALRWRGDRADGRGWKLCCPLGHTWWYIGETEVARERRLRKAAQERASAERDLRVDTEYRLRAQKGATTKARKRHAAGVCPCCSRTFQQLQRHMATKHPDYDPARPHA